MIMKLLWNLVTQKMKYIMTPMTWRSKELLLEHEDIDEDDVGDSQGVSKHPLAIMCSDK